LTFPRATYETDPAGGIVSRYREGDFATKASPVLYGNGPAFYDLAKKRWVPVGPAQSSPDGAFYAYGTLNPSNPGAPYLIHVLDVATATDRTFTVQPRPEFGNAIGPYVTDFDGSAVYFSSVQSMGPPSGAFKLDIRSGAVQQVSKIGGEAFTSGGYAWANRIDPRDPDGPQTGRSGPRSNSVVRVDLLTGEETVWYFAGGQMVYMYGLDRAGKPLVAIAPGPDFSRTALRLVGSPQDDGSLIYDGAGGLWFNSPQPDNQARLWFGNDRGIYLYTPAKGLQKVFVFRGNPTFGESIQPAGLCV
jgi:hypothetical protein